MILSPLIDMLPPLQSLLCSRTDALNENRLAVKIRKVDAEMVSKGVERGFSSPTQRVYIVRSLPLGILPRPRLSRYLHNVYYVASETGMQA